MEKITSFKGNILFSIYTGEYPNQFAGGPNNIIYKIINNYKGNKLEFDYLSNDLFAENLTAENLHKLRNQLSVKKKTASFLSEKFSLYRKFFGSDFYLPYHFYKKQKYYKTFPQNIAKYDIVHSKDSISLSLITKKNTSSKKIMTVHSKGPLSDEIRNMAKNRRLQNTIDIRLKRIERKNIELADIITFPSRAAKEYFEKGLGIALSENKVKIIYNGIDFNRIQSVNDDKVLVKYSIEKRQNQLLLLNIAGGAPEKRIDFLLKIVNKIKYTLKQDILLLNIGVEGKKIKRMVDELNLENNVKFLGKIPNEDVIKFLKATDIFVMTSQKVIFDLVVLEALASGACCVVSDDGGNKEIIKDGINGYFINPDNIEESARKIISINPNLVKENAIKTAQQFSVQKMVDGYFNLYEELLNGV